MDNKLLLAAAIAGITLGLSATETKKEESKTTNVDGQCFEVNSCKGTSACHSQSNSCAGTNSCKGKGWIKMSEKECKAKKGKFKAV